jgi:hypothetical protein
MAQAGIPLPRPRPDAAGAGAVETSATPLDWLQNVFHSSSTPAAPPAPEDSGTYQETPH